jgi:glucose/mannose-6-phosphate isomerase
LTTDSSFIDVSFDRKGLLRDYRTWPETGLKTLEDLPQVHVDPHARRVFVAGMGASSAAGEFLRDALAQSYLRVNVLRSHIVPSDLGKDDLIIGMSLSGGTEETAYVFDQALRRGASGIAIASGGLLKTIAEKRGAEFLKIEGGATARSSFPVFVSTLAGALDGWKPDLGLRGRLSEAFGGLSRISAAYSDPDPERSAPAKTAAWLQEATHTSAYYSPFNLSVGTRFKNVLSENAKMDCTITDVMDVMHDGITCWEHDFGSRLLLLHSWRDDEVVNHRFSLIGAQVRSLGFQTTDVTSGNAEGVQDLLHSFYYVDLVSVFSALLRRLDPGVTQSQEVLKQKLGKVSTLRKYLNAEYG